MQINFLKVIPASVAISVAISCFSVKSYAQATEKQDSLAVAEQHLGRGDIYFLVDRMLRLDCLGKQKAPCCEPASWARQK